MKIVLLGTPEVENKGKYNQLLVKYQSDGKDSERKIMSFTFKEVYETLKTAQTGDAFDVKLEKDGKYCNWVHVKPLGREAVEAGSSSKKPVGTWETAEERAFKQICIVRQSSLSNAFPRGEMYSIKRIWPEQAGVISCKLRILYNSWHTLFLSSYYFKLFLNSKSEHFVLRTEYYLFKKFEYFDGLTSLIILYTSLNTCSAFGFDQ